MTLCSALWDIVLTAIGVWIGFYIAIEHERKKSARELKEEKRRVLRSLLQSLEKSSEHITQMYTTHFPNQDYPSYPLDTDSLNLIVHDTKRILPENGSWPKKVNSLRFEFDHINRKILMNYLAGTPICGTSLSNDWAAYNTTARTLPSQPHTLLGISYLILKAKGDLDDLISDLKIYLKE